jgi:hypothetical protein
MTMYRFRKIRFLFSVLTVFSVALSSLPISAFAEVYTGELQLPNTKVLPSKGGGAVSVTAFSSYSASTPAFSLTDSNNNFVASLPQKSFSASIRGSALNCTGDDINLNPANNSVILTYIAPATDSDQGGDPLCLPTEPTTRDVTFTNQGSANSYGGIGVTQEHNISPYLTLGEAAQTTTVESIPNDPNNVRVTITNNVTEEAYGVHFERKGDVWTVYNYVAPWAQYPEYGAIVKDGKTYVLNWLSNWVGQVPIYNGGCDEGYCPIIWGDPSTVYYREQAGPGGHLGVDPLYVNTGYPTPQIVPLGAVDASDSESVIRPRNSAIVSVTQPQCTRWSDGNFWRTVQHVHCRTYGISADGRTGYGDYYDSQSSGGWFQEFLAVGLIFAGFAFGAQFMTSFIGTVAEQMVAIQSIAIEQGLAVSSSALGNVIGDVLAANVSFAGVAGSIGNSAALASLSAFTTASIAAISGPTTALGTVENSNGLGVGTWVWTEPPEYRSSTEDSSSTCQDTLANNYGSPLPCTYNPGDTCQDPAANNFGAVLPCTYNGETCGVANICGTTDIGTPVNGTCNAIVPALPAGYSTSCASSANNCGDTSAGVVGCNGLCSAQAPANRASCDTPPATCSITSICGNTNTGVLVNSVCSVSVPDDPAGYGSLCSISNICGDTNQGRVGCNGCSVSAPPNRACIDEPVDGVCSIPTTHYSCIKGTSENPSETASSWSWDCAGSNNGATVSCTESKFNGRCSATHWGCTLGSVDPASQTGGSTGPWTWTCKGFNGGDDASCTQPNVGFGYCPDRVTPLPPSGVCPDTVVVDPSFCPDGSPRPVSGLCPGDDTTNGLCANPATYFNLCTNGRVYNWIDTNPALRIWDCVGSGPGATTARCSQDVTTLCVDRSIRLCTADGNYSITKECGVENSRTRCDYGCSSGECQLPQAVNITRFEAKPRLVKKNTPTNVYWDVENASSCTISSSATGTNADSWTTRATWPNTNTSGAGGRQSHPIQGHTVFTLVCNPFSGDSSLSSQSATATVDIAPIFQEL